MLPHLAKPLNLIIRGEERGLSVLKDQGVEVLVRFQLRVSNALRLGESGGFCVSDGNV